MAKNKGLFELHDAAFNIGVNVRVRKINRYTGHEIERREGHNRCLKMQLMGIVKWLNGEFNDTQPFLLHYNWIPRYLGVGTNIATADTPGGITSEVSINDARLLDEISPRIKLPDRNKIVNRSTQNYIQLIISTYLPEEYYIDESIGEAGLFSGETGNNCLFRITFDPIVKDVDSIIEVNWTISVISVESTGEVYEEIDKTDLRLAMNSLLDKFAELHPDIAEACEHLKSPAIYNYGRLDASQNEIDQATTIINQDYNNLNKTE